jgi:threonine synthase
MTYKNKRLSEIEASFYHRRIRANAVSHALVGLKPNSWSKLLDRIKEMDGLIGIQMYRQDDEGLAESLSAGAVIVINSSTCVCVRKGNEIGLLCSLQSEPKMGNPTNQTDVASRE